MKEKIVQLMKNEGLSPSRLAEVLDTQPSRISHIVSGRNKPSFDLLQQILRRFPQINPDWLLLDSPTMYRGGESAVADLSQGDFDSAPIDLFGMGGVEFGGVNDVVVGAQNSAFSAASHSQNSGDNFTRSAHQNNTAGRGENRAQNIMQNSPQNISKNGSQNSPKNAPQNADFFDRSAPQVERVIVLYTDGTFATYKTR